MYGGCGRIYLSVLSLGLLVGAAAPLLQVAAVLVVLLVLLLLRLLVLPLPVPLLPPTARQQGLSEHGH